MASHYEDGGHRHRTGRRGQRGLYDDPSPWGWVVAAAFVLLVGAGVVLLVTMG